MRYKFHIILVVVMLIVSGVTFWLGQLVGGPIEPDEALRDRAVPVHYAQYASKEFYGNADGAEPELEAGPNVRGAIVSHHLFVAQDIANLYAGLKGRNIKTVAVIGPNHFFRGDEALVSAYDYETPWGRLEVNRGVVSKLVKDGVVALDEKPFEIEHSISSQVGFIKAVLPEATFVPIILKRSVDQAEAERLAESLYQALPENSIVVASVDFAHHVTNQQAQEDDKKSIDAIRDFDFPNLYDQHYDSPPSIYALLAYLNLRGAKKMSYKNTNSALVSGNLSSTDVTSYVFAYFFE